MRASPPSAPSRLFHTIAVVGASLGCGTSQQAHPFSSGAPPGGTDASGLVPGDGASSDGPSAPQGICDCARPGEFRCDACAMGEAPIQGRCEANDGIDCRCDTTVQFAAPSDCTHPEQFVCEASPDLDAAVSTVGFGADAWFAFADCSCDPTRPVMPSQCTCEQCSFVCSGVGCPAPDAGSGLAVGARWDCACEVLPPVTAIAPAL